MPLKLTRIQPAAVPETGGIITPAPLQLPGTPGQVEGQTLKQAGQDIKQFGDLALRLSIDLKERDDKTLAGNAYLGFSGQMREIENKYYSRKGINAQGAFEEYQQDVDTAFNNSINSIESTRAQGLFNSVSQSRRISSSTSMRTYERAQLDKAHLETSNALVEDGTQDAIENYNNPIAIQDARNKIIIGVGQAADLLGWSAKQEKVALENAVSKMHVGIIRNMLVDNAGSAKDYMEANIKEIQGTDQVELEEKVKRYGTLQESQALADDIHAQGINKNLSLTDKLALIPKDDADVRKATEALLRQKEADDEYAELQTRDEQKENFYRVLNDQNADNKIKIKAVNSIEHQGDRNNALAMIRTQQDQALAIRKLQVQKQSPVETFNAKDAIDRGAITNQNQLIEGFFNKVTSSDFNFLTNYLRQGGQIGDLKPSTYNTAFRNIIGKPEDNRVAYLGTVKFIRDQVQAGNSPTQDNINQWVVTSSTAGEEIEGHLFSDMSFAKATARGVGHLWLPDIEDHEEDLIIESIKNYNNSNPNDQIEINEFNRRLWKRMEILQLPAPDPSIESLF